jgi:hypothetical protein
LEIYSTSLAIEEPTAAPFPLDTVTCCSDKNVKSVSSYCLVKTFAAYTQQNFHIFALLPKLIRNRDSVVGGANGYELGD